jgi:hypothetical protein
MVFEQRAGGPIRIAAGSLLKELANFRVADESIILYQTGSALIALGHMPKRYLEGLLKRCSMFSLFDIYLSKQRRAA